MRKTASGYRLIFGYLGLFIAFVGVALFLPLIALLAFPDEAKDWYCFAIPGGGAILLGIILFLLIARRTKGQLGKHQDAILLVLIWVCAIFISAVPFLLQKDMDLSFTDALFETTSCYATVGLSIFKESDYTHHIFVLYRSVLCFLGGIGLVLIITSAISDRYGLKLYIAEGHNDKLMPNLARSARIILAIYTGFMLLGIGLYMLAGMNWYDAIVHSVSAVATAGFSSHPEGLVFFAGSNNFWAIQVVSIVLMLLGATNFVLALFLLTGRFKKVFKDSEIKFFGGLCLVFIPLFLLAAWLGGKVNGFGNTFVQSTFTFVSAITTTGFANTPDLTLLGEGVLLLVVLMTVIGGGMGSTSGGVKQYRVVVAIKSFLWSTKEATASSNTIFPHYIYRCGQEKEVDQQEVASSFGFIILYIVIMLLGGLFVSILNNNLDYGHSLFEFANALSCTGLSIGVTTASSVGAKWVLITGMLLGRLEILAIFLAAFRFVKDIFRKETY